MENSVVAVLCATFAICSIQNFITSVVKRNVSDSFIYSYRILSNFQHNWYIGSQRDFYPISLIFTQCEAMLSRLIFSKFNVFCFSSLRDMYFILIRWRGLAHFAQFFKPQMPLHTSMYNTKSKLYIYLNLRLIYRFLQLLA